MVGHRAGQIGHGRRDLLRPAETAHVVGDGAHDAERTALFLSVIAGVWLMRKVIGDTALTDADPAVLSRHLEAMFQTLVEPALESRATTGDA